MQQIDPRDRWEYLRIRLSALGSKNGRPVSARQNGGSGTSLLSMPAIPGFHFLREILEKEGKLPQDRAVGIALGVCAELSRLHRSGTVHGNLSPAKVLLGPDGLVQLIGTDSVAEGIGGKFRKRPDTAEAFAYVSPEQAAGRTPEVRSDLYALGILLYEILTGKLPFEGLNAFAMMNDRLVNYPVPPRVLVPEVTSSLQEVIYRALERAPRRRYNSATEMALDLANPSKVIAEERPALRAWIKRRSPWVPVWVNIARSVAAVGALLGMFYWIVGRT